MQCRQPCRTGSCFTAHDPVRRGCDQSHWAQFGWNEVREMMSGEMRWVIWTIRYADQLALIRCYSHTCLSLAKQYNLVPVAGQRCPAAGKVTVGSTPPVVAWCFRRRSISTFSISVRTARSATSRRRRTSRLPSRFLTTIDPMTATAGQLASYNSCLSHRALSVLVA